MFDLQTVNLRTTPSPTLMDRGFLALLLHLRFSFSLQFCLRYLDGKVILHFFSVPHKPSVSCRTVQVRHAETGKRGEKYAETPVSLTAHPLLGEPNVKLFVGNVPAQCDEALIYDLFASVGPVSEVVLLPVNSTGVRGALVHIPSRSLFGKCGFKSFEAGSFYLLRFFGFPQLFSRLSADVAISKLHGMLLLESKIPLHVRFIL